LADLGKKSCRNCGCAHEAHTRLTKVCTVCTRFASLRSNAAHVRRTGKAPGLGFDLPEFAAWFAGQERSCAYCRVPEEYVRHLRLRTQVGLPLQRLGVDRVDGGRGYEIDNIVLCCFACNKARSNTFSAAEMEITAKGISKVWTMRLEKAGIAWRRPSRTRRASASGKKPATTKRSAVRRARKGASSRSAKHRTTTAR
jgi:5-methylcytosine-specific restriction endonuclease McrA